MTALPLRFSKYPFHSTDLFHVSFEMSFFRHASPIIQLKMDDCMQRWAKVNIPIKIAQFQNVHNDLLNSFVSLQRIPDRQRPAAKLFIGCAV
jgi:hypothetical protein